MADDVGNLRNGPITRDGVIGDMLFNLIDLIGQMIRRVDDRRRWRRVSTFFIILLGGVALLSAIPSLVWLCPGGPSRDHGLRSPRDRCPIRHQRRLNDA
jgi:hypothetical protein